MRSLHYAVNSFGLVFTTVALLFSLVCIPVSFNTDLHGRKQVIATSFYVVLSFLLLWADIAIVLNFNS